MCIRDRFCSHLTPPTMTYIFFCIPNPNLRYICPRVTDTIIIYSYKRYLYDFIVISNSLPPNDIYLLPQEFILPSHTCSANLNMLAFPSLVFFPCSGRCTSRGLQVLLKYHNQHSHSRPYITFLHSNLGQ